MGNVKDLVEEAKKRIVLLLVCVFGLSYLMSCKWCFWEFDFVGIDWKFHLVLHVLELGSLVEFLMSLRFNRFF